MCNYFKNFYVYSSCKEPAEHFIRTSFDHDGPKSTECSDSPHDRFIVVGSNCILCDPKGGGDLPDESDEELNSILARDYSKTYLKASAPQNKVFSSANSRMTSSHDDSGYASRATRSSENKTRKPGPSHLKNTGPKEKYASMAANRSQLKEEQHETDNRFDTSDAESVYTAGPSIHPQRRDAYIVVFADELLGGALPEETNESLINSLCAALPDLLKTFATMVGAAEATQIHGELMVFIRRHRHHITRIVEKSLLSGAPRDQKTDIKLDDLVWTWLQQSDLFEDPDIQPRHPSESLDSDDEYELDQDKEAVENNLPELGSYKKLVSKLPAYEWLVQSIWKELHLTPVQGAYMGVREEILLYLPRSRQISRTKSAERIQADFTLNWDPSSFLEEQEYPPGLKEPFEQALVITGSETNAQATTVSQYVRQTWPFFGVELMHLVQRALQSPSAKQSCSFVDGTNLSAWSAGSEFICCVAGIPDIIAELGEQLAWMGSALRSLKAPDRRVSMCKQVVILKSETIEPGISRTCLYIDFRATPISNDYRVDKPDGQCWHQLFKSPVIVDGFSIPRRPSHYPGLEISLDAMANLVGTKRVETFDNQFFIKGFSVMLVPTHCEDNLIIWHMITSKNGDRITYLDAPNNAARNITPSQLETSRHILGWCSKIRYLAGTADASYAIDRSWLQPPSANSQFKGASVSAGFVVTCDDTAALGKRDRSDEVLRGTLRVRLSAMLKKYIVLWDVETKRGWLVNVPSVLLHLLRASLESNKTDDFSFAFLFKPQQFQESHRPHSRSSALEVLINPQNLNIKLYQDCETENETDKFFRIRDRVEILYAILEKMVDYQALITGQNGEKIKTAPRKYLEGWDFKDIATNSGTANDCIYPQVEKLKTAGKTWVDFTRALQAVFLFGRGFGEIIEPAEKNERCQYWGTLPSKKYYMAASMEDLINMMDRLGNPKSMPPRLVGSISWYPGSSSLTERCPCETTPQVHSELAHTLLPSHLDRRLPICSSSPLSATGAAIFGYNSNDGWLWGDIGDPEQGVPSASDDQYDSDDHGQARTSNIGIPIRNVPMTGTSSSVIVSHQYRIAIICALPQEMMAVRALFDDLHPKVISQDENDSNSYVFGRMAGHNVVTACLPSGEYGTNAASKVASDLQRSFPAVKFIFVVGIGGGVPSSKHDIRLGDVVVSTAIFQHDMGKVTSKNSTLNRTGTIQLPARSLRTAINSIRSDPRIGITSLEAHIAEIVKLRPDYQRPKEMVAREPIWSGHLHVEGVYTCEKCSYFEAPWTPRGPRVHYGLIASGNQVIKDALVRDHIAKDLDILCFEMESAGVMTTGQCLVIRGISDYADAGKNDEWHNYAAAVAAAYTKLFLSNIDNLETPIHRAIQVQPALDSNKNMYFPEMIR